jgi:hypothetical protein
VYNGYFSLNAGNWTHLHSTQNVKFPVNLSDLIGKTINIHQKIRNCQVSLVLCDCNSSICFPVIFCKAAYELIPVKALFVCVRRQTGTDKEAVPRNDPADIAPDDDPYASTFALRDGKATTGPAVALWGPKMETMVLLSSDKEDNDETY